MRCGGRRRSSFGSVMEVNSAVATIGLRGSTSVTRKEGGGREVQSGGAAAHDRRMRGQCAASHHDDGRLQREDFIAEAQRHRPGPSHSSSWIHDDLTQARTILQLITIIVISNEIMCLPRNCVILVELGSRPHLMGDARDRTFDPADAVMRRSTMVRPAKIEAATCPCFRSSSRAGAVVACGDLRTMAADHQTSGRSGAAARARRDPR